MWIQLALGRSRITFKQPSFKLESVKKKKKTHSNHGTKVPSLQYATSQERKSEEVKSCLQRREPEHCSLGHY